jgi:hypothetical protein
VRRRSFGTAVGVEKTFPGAAEDDEVSMHAIVGWKIADERLASGGEETPATLLRGALERDDGEMPAVAEIADVEVELDSRLTPYQRPWARAGGAAWPSRSGLEARGTDCGTPMMVDLVGGRASEPGMWPMPVVPRDVDPEVLLEAGKPIRNRDEPARALALDRPDAALDHGEASVLADGPEALADSPATTPAPEFPSDELPAVI